MTKTFICNCKELGQSVIDTDTATDAARQYIRNFGEDGRTYDVHVEDPSAAPAEDELGPVATIRVRTVGRDIGEQPWENYAHVDAAFEI